MRIPLSLVVRPTLAFYGRRPISQISRHLATNTLPIPVLNTQQVVLHWDDRLQLQNTWTLPEKGWNVTVEWKTSKWGVGLFAAQDVAADTILRHGILGRNLFQFHSTRDIEAFCQSSSDDDEEYQARLRYVTDYLWGFNPRADERGYALAETASSLDDRFFGMWIPGNGLNHNNSPNTVYRQTMNGIDLVALCDIAKGQELFDDYRRHGSAPEWLKQFAKEKQVSLNFADCNDFVVPLPKETS